MNTGPGNDMPTTWQTLADALGGSFTARARGLLNPEITLSTHNGEPFGRLMMRGTEGADLAVGVIEARIRRAGDSRYVLSSGGSEVLAAEPAGSLETLHIQHGDRSYEAGISPLRNTAVARTPENKEATRVSGGLANRRYEATFDGASLPVAVFLLYHLVTLRGRAFQTRP